MNPDTRAAWFAFGVLFGLVGVVSSQWLTKPEKKEVVCQYCGLHLVSLEPSEN
jgi:hypothetical protein